MPTKIFTTIIGPCPFGMGCAIDSTTCRQCPFFFRMGTATFFWCKHPTPAPAPAISPKKRGPGRPRKTEKEKTEVEFVKMKRTKGRPAGKAGRKAVNRLKKSK